MILIFSQAFDYLSFWSEELKAQSIAHKVVVWEDLIDQNYTVTLNQSQCIHHDGFWKHCTSVYCPLLSPPKHLPFDESQHWLALIYFLLSQIPNQVNPLGNHTLAYYHYESAHQRRILSKAGFTLPHASAHRPHQNSNLPKLHCIENHHLLSVDGRHQPCPPHLSLQAQNIMQALNLRVMELHLTQHQDQWQPHFISHAPDWSTCAKGLEYCLNLLTSLLRKPVYNPNIGHA